MTKQSNKTQKLAVGSGREVVRRVPSAARSERLPTGLHLSKRSSLADLAPADILFLDDFANLREFLAPNFIAVLARPLCGSPGLITSAQYSGGVPIVCASEVCSGLFRIVDECQIVSLLLS